ncbi:hypothetical protein [Brevundimonas naejangsanensis]|uniref:hypothetical protein n=1 Tax=Brevundimonas naejangsanensis TaxID=588932 RepID=UPI0026EB90AE|nr:hypothetical protein [Brevundimonas naejangsanensis]
MAAPDAAALAPFALPLRREADAVIADADGQTVLIIDPSRNLDEDAAERIADLVFARLTAAAPEVGTVLRHHDGRTGAFVCTEGDGRYRVQSLREAGFWVFHPDDCDEPISGAAPPKDEVLPVAWVIRTKDGHIHMWTMSEARARMAAAAWGMEAKQEGLSPITRPASDALRGAVEALEKAVWSLSSFGQLADDADGGNTEGLDDEVIVRMTFPDPEFGGEKTLLGELFIRAFRKAKAVTSELRQALAALQQEGVK